MTGISTFTIIIQHSTGSLGDSNQRRQRNKRHPNWKGRIKIVISADNMIPYIENPKDSTKNLLKLVNEFGQVVQCKIFIQKSVAFLYTNNELSERKTKRTISFKIAF